MSGTPRYELKRTHSWGRILAGVVFFLAVCAGLPAFFLVWVFLKDLSAGLPAPWEHEEGLWWVLGVESESLFGRKVRRFARGDVRQIDVVSRVEHTDGTKKKRRVSNLRLRGGDFQFVLGSDLPRAELLERARELRAALGLEQSASEDPRRSSGG